MGKTGRGHDRPALVAMALTGRAEAKPRGEQHQIMAEARATTRKTMDDSTAWAAGNGQAPSTCLQKLKERAEQHTRVPPPHPQLPH